MIPLKFGRYLRVSTEDQGMPGHASIPTQDADTAALIAREGGILVDTYTDDKRYRVGRRLTEPSGERTDRPGWMRLLADIKSGRINAVAAWHSSRLYRNYRPAIDFLELVEEQNVAVRLCTEGFDQHFAMLMAWRDREENKTRVTRFQMGKASKAEDGFNATGHSLFYRTLRNADGKRAGYALCDEYRPFLDRLAELFLARVSYADMARQLVTNPANGKRLSSNGVRQLMVNPWYLGRIAYGRTSEKANAVKFTAKGLQPAAWDGDTCARISVELERRAEIGRSVARIKRPGDPGLFRGVARCGFCGRVMTAYYSQGRRYYMCAMGYAWRLDWGPKHGLPHAGNNVSEKLMLSILRELLEMLAQADIEAILPLFASPQPIRVDPTRLELLRSQLADTQAELESLPAAAARSRVALATDIQRQQVELEILSADLEEQQHAPFDVERLRAQAISLPATLADPAVSQARKRDILAETFPALYVKEHALCLPPAL